MTAIFFFFAIFSRTILSFLNVVLNDPYEKKFILLGFSHTKVEPLRLSPNFKRQRIPDYTECSVAKLTVLAKT
jgi:hypothetical protein